MVLMQAADIASSLNTSELDEPFRRRTLRLVASRRNLARQVIWDSRLATHESWPVHHLRERSFMPDE
jgi:hypothetical protein